MVKQHNISSFEVYACVALIRIRRTILYKTDIKVNHALNFNLQLFNSPFFKKKKKLFNYGISSLIFLYINLRNIYVAKQ